MIKKTSTIAFASDHAGYDLKNSLYMILKDEGYNIIDLGVNNETTSVDYPDFGFAMGQAITNNEAEYGVLICGSGIGISIAANRFPTVRAALCHDVTSARLCREHNDANVLVLGSRLIGTVTAEDCLRAFLNTEFAGDRHQNRVDKLSLIINQ